MDWEEPLTSVTRAKTGPAGCGSATLARSLRRVLVTPLTAVIGLALGRAGAWRAAPVICTCPATGNVALIMVPCRKAQRR